MVERSPAATYRERANELRQIAETVADKNFREAIVRLAEDYERRAREIEEWIKRKIAAHSKPDSSK